MQISAANNGQVTFIVNDVTKGYWAWPSPVVTQEGYVPLMQNFDLPGGIPTSMLGDGIFINTAFDNSHAITLAAVRKVAGSDPTPIIATEEGKVWYWTGAAWAELRRGLSTTAALWWSDEQYGDDLFIANATDGIYRFDGTSLLPIGAKSIVRCENSEAGDWTNETVDAADFQEGEASVKVQSANPGASAILTYNPAAVIDTATGRVSAKTYDLVKATGTDCYHFKVKFSNGAGSTITAATTTFVITDTLNKSLTWAASLWHSTKSTSGSAIPLNDNSWHDVYVFPSEATEVATFNPTVVDKLEWKVTTSANQTYMLIDDVYSIYLQTMPACQIVKEWKNLLFGFNGSTYHFSKVAAPDEYHTLANSSLKSGGESIKGVARFFNQLTIGTDTHIITISGSTQGSTYPSYLFDQNEVTDEIGMDSHRSIVKADNTLFWYWKKQIVRYNGTKADTISYPIDAYLDGIDESKAQQIVGAPFRKKHELWWTWRRSGQAVNDRILKFDHKWQAFMSVLGLTTPVIFKSTSSGAEKCLTILESSGKIYEQNKAASYQFSGVDIAYALELPAMSIPGQSLQWIQNFLEYLNNTGNVVLQFRQGDTLRALQGASYETAETIVMNADGEYGKNRIGERSAWMQIKFTATAANVQLQPPFIVVARQQATEFIRNTP